jgi:ankyrin repeat protein
VRETARQALAGPIGADDLDAVRLLLAAGADPNRYRDDDDRPAGAVAAAVEAGASHELIELLLAHGAAADAPAADGRSPRRLAMAQGRSDIVELLDRHGARDDATAIERLVYACLRADRPEADRLLASDPQLTERLARAGAEPLARAAESGHVEAIRLLLDHGVPIDALDGEHGGSALHAAAYAGVPEAVAVLLERGAAIEARDRTWSSTPLEWALVGSGERPAKAAHPDWIETVRILIEGGADTTGITLSPDEPKPPSPEVERFLRARGIG